MNGIWSFRLLMWFVLWLMTQPHFRFPFLIPFHIADMLFIGAFGLHVLNATSHKRPIIKMGIVTKLSLCLLSLALVSHYFNPIQRSTAWNGEIDMIFKVTFVLILLEAQVDSIYKATAVLGTLGLGSLWWIKGGMRLSLSGATLVGDRIMGVNVSMISNPNELAYMMAVMIPLFLLLYKLSKNPLLKYGGLGGVGMAVFVILNTGSRTGLLCLLVMGLYVLPRLLKEDKSLVIAGGVGLFFLLGVISTSNLDRFKSMKKSAVAFLTKSNAPIETMSQDELSATSRMTKIRDTSKLILRYPVLGVGTAPKKSVVTQGLTFAKGKVHNEILMAGRQMGIGGMIIYLMFLLRPWVYGTKMERELKFTWPELATLGWMVKGQMVVIAAGGSFAPMAWNFPHMLIASSTMILYQLAMEEGVLRDEKNVTSPAQGSLRTA